MSEGLGTGFVIGEDPIGTPPFDWTQTLLAQYADSPTITALISSFAAAVDPATDLDNFYDYVWNIASAQGFGLDIWGRILGVGRVYLVADPYHFGFSDSQGTPKDVGAFGEGVFWNGGPPSGNFALADPSYRRLLLAKAYSLITNTSAAALNALLRLLFPGRGNCYIADNGGMSVTWTFTFPLSPVEKTIVQTSGVLPVPNGTAVSFSFV